MIRLSIKSFSIAIAVAVLAAPTAARADLTSIGYFNLITTGDVTSDNSDVQGRVLVGGTLKVNNFPFGGSLTSSGIGLGTSGTNGVFNILGVTTNNVGVTNPNNTNTPNAYYGTNNSGGTVTSATQNTSIVNSYTNNLTSILTNLSTGASNSFATLATNSTATVDSQNSTVTFAATPTTIGGKSVAVFSVNASVFGTPNESFNLTGGTSSTSYIINVLGASGSAINFNSSLQFNNFVNAHNSANILFNFEGVTGLNGIQNLGASILAPVATLNTNNTLTGGVYVGSIASTGEIDLAQSNSTLTSGYTGFAPAAVPEPASVAMMLIGGGLAALVARRHKAARA